MDWPHFEGPGFTEPPVNWEGCHNDHTENERDHYWDYLSPEETGHEAEWDDLELEF